MRRSIIVILLIALCRGAFGQARVAPVFSTAAAPGANVDSCAVWVAPPGGVSLLFVTEKDGDRIQVWNASTGARHLPKPFLGGVPDGSLPGELNRPNGVWVIPHVPHDGGFSDILLVTDQMNLRVQVFRLPGLEYFGEVGTGEVGKGYGIAWLVDGPDFHVFITDNIPPPAFPGKIKRYRLRPSPAGIGADLVFGTGSSTGSPPLPNVESIAADLFHDRLHVCGDEGGSQNRIFRLDGASTGTTYGGPQFEEDQEGINIYDTGGGDGYLIVSDQYTSAPNQFEIFDRRTLAPLGNFTSPPGGPIVTFNTDGAYLEQRPLPGFPNGAFYAVNDDKETHAYDWTDIAEAKGLEIVALDRPFPGRAPGPGTALGTLWFQDSSWWGALPRGDSLTISRLEDGTFASIQAIDSLGPGDSVTAAIASGGALAILVAGEAARIHLLDYDPSSRRYQKRGDPVVLGFLEGSLAALILEEGPGGGAAAGRLAWVSGGMLWTASSGASLDVWSAPHSLGEASAVAPRLARTPAATAVLWAGGPGAGLSLHLDAAGAASWTPREPVEAGPISALAAAALPDGRILAAGSGADGSAWLRSRSAKGAWSGGPITGEAGELALVPDPARGRLHLFHGVPPGGKRALFHREGDLDGTALGPPRLFAGWPGVDLASMQHPAGVPSAAADLAAAAFGDDGLGYFGRILLPSSEDRGGPVTLQHSPGPGATGVPDGSTLEVRVIDDRSGTNRARLKVFLNGIEVARRARGAPRNLLVSVALPPGLGPRVQVRIEAADLATEPHVMIPFEYEFSTAAAESRFQRGDANGDRTIDLSDAVKVLLTLFAGHAAGCLDAVDSNDDGETTISDAIHILLFLFQRGPSPTPSGPACGPDETPDELGCEVAPPCAPPQGGLGGVNN